MDINYLYRLFLRHRSVSTDTRNILENSIFFALKGDSFDGNDYASEALQRGAAFAVVDNPSVVNDERIILTENVLQTLQNLAEFHRKQFTIPFLAITGSNGKTTTKELIQATLSEGFRVYATRGNLNNHIGVPLTLLEIPDETEIAIIEMGANHQGEIENLCKIAQPTHGLITNIGKAHLEGFGGYEGVKKAKGELYVHLKETSGHIFINTGNPILIEVLGNYPLVTSYNNQATDCKAANAANYVGHTVKADPLLSLTWSKCIDSNNGETFRVDTQLAGSYNLENVLAAVTLGQYFGLTAAQVGKGISNYLPKNNRSQVVESTRGNHLICDYYNANASSMWAALENFSQIPALKKQMILGDMFELGESAAEEHRTIIEKALALEISHTIFVGKNFFDQKGQYADRGDLLKFFENLEDCAKHLEFAPIQDSWVLMKGSRGMTLERLIKFL